MSKLHALRVGLARKICPDDHRVVDVCMGDEDTFNQGNGILAHRAARDLINGGDALARGWGCDPLILYNGASWINELITKERAS